MSDNILMIRMSISFLAFSIITFGFKHMYENYRHTLWEDIYVRSLIFFICSAVEYLRQGPKVSLFEIKPQIRITLFLRVLCISFAYIFYMQAVRNTASFVYVSLIVCLLPLLSKFIQRLTVYEKNLSFLDTVSFGVSVVGLVFLFRGNSKFTNDSTTSFDNSAAYFLGILSIILWGFSTYFLHKS